MDKLKVMKARRALDPAALRDPLGEDAPAPTERRRRPKAPSRPAPRGTIAPPRLEAPPSEAMTATGDVAMFDLVAGPRSAIAVMFDADLWVKLVELVGELRSEGLRLSANALLVLILAEGLPSDEAAALDLVGRRELALCDQRTVPRREERTMRLPRQLLERYTTLGARAAAHGFGGARSAVVNAVVAITGPRTVAEARALETRARRARSAAVIRRDAAPPA